MLVTQAVEELRPMRQETVSGRGDETARMAAIPRMEGPAELMGFAEPRVLATGAIRGLLDGS